jgi:hypothetical protein
VVADVPVAGTRREVRAALLIVVALLIVSALGGVVWGFLAPTEQLFVLKPGKGSTLTGESVHQFDALAIFVCIGAVTGVLSALGAWRRRAARGPLLLLGLLIGSIAGAFVMSKVGEQVMEWQHPRPHNPPVGQIVVVPVDVGSWLALIVQPLFAALVVLFLAALSPSADLGTGFAGPFGESRPVRSPSRSGTSTFDGAYAPGPYSGAANGGPVPYGDAVPYGYRPGGESGSRR